MEFGSLKTEVEGWVLDLPAGLQAKIGSFVNEAVKDACKRHNFAFMEAEALPTTTLLQRALTISPAKPVDWKEHRGDPYLFRQDGSTREISWAASESDMIRTYAIQLPDEGNTTPADKGEPRHTLERPDQFDVFPLPDDLSDWNNGNYRLVIPYWAFPATLTGNNDHNWITDNGDFYVIYKAATIGFRYNRDEERAQYFDGLAEPLYKRIERMDKLAKLPGRISLGVYKDVYAGKSRIGNRG